LTPPKYNSTIASITVVESPAADLSTNPHPHHRPGVSAPASQNARADLNPKYTFDTFVVGSHNRFVHSAALNVAAKPGTSYNPLFIYGGVGLGKTHIMQAIGHEILKHSPHLLIRYMSCERFINDFINCLRDKSMSEFRKRYRMVDVLLIDDIQFIEGKESSQEEFFHTFNALRESGRQLVLSSDRPPKAIAAIEERMRSRLEQGLVADIQAPDLETRVAILRKKRDLDHMQVNDDALEYIASLHTTNIRELEGALIRTHAYASMGGSDLTPEMLRSILNPGAPEKQKKNLTIDQIINVVAAHYRVESSEVRSSKRTADLTTPRHIAMYLAHEIMKMSFPRIGEAFSNRKHTSALYAYDKVKELLGADADLAYTVKQLTRQLTD
jgi:chromosomal replication initiator protein